MLQVRCRWPVVGAVCWRIIGVSYECSMMQAKLRQYLKFGRTILRILSNGGTTEWTRYGCKTKLLRKYILLDVKREVLFFSYHGWFLSYCKDAN